MMPETADCKMARNKPPRLMVLVIMMMVMNWLIEESKGMKCYIIQEPDPNSNYDYRWVIPVQEPCLCTKVMVGGMSTLQPFRPYEVTYYDSFLHSDDLLEIQTWLGCRSSPPCSFGTEPKNPHTFSFILKPLTMPFRLDFTLKSQREPLVALARSQSQDDIFAEINIGGWGNTKSVIRPCRSITSVCNTLLAVHDEADIVSAHESRPFWIEYKDGVVRVGKGGQLSAFLEWDANSGSYQPAPTRVYIGIASWQVASAQWLFYQYCE